MPKPRATSLALLVLVLGGCMSSPGQSAALEPTAGPASEMAYLDYPGPTWHDTEGRAVSGEVINVIRGADHCGWQSVAFLHVGWPLGTEAQSSTQMRQYVRDPQGVLPPGIIPPTLELAADLPADAAPSGYVADRLELWISPSEVDQAVYLVVEDRTERWPRAEEVIACA